MTWVFILTVAFGVGEVASTNDAGSAGLGISAPRPNLLKTATVTRAENALRPHLLSDGVASTDGDIWDNPRALILEQNGVIEWELSQIEIVRGMRIQADNNDRYLISGSTDGKNWFVLWAAGPVDLPGVQTRTAPELPGRPVRYLRLTADGGDAKYSITELEVFDSPASLKAARLQRIEPPPPPPPAPAPPFDSGLLIVALVTASGAYYVHAIRRRNRGLATPPKAPEQPPGSTSGGEPPKS